MKRNGWKISTIIAIILFAFSIGERIFTAGKWTGKWDEIEKDIIELKESHKLTIENNAKLTLLLNYFDITDNSSRYDSANAKK